MDRQSVPPDRNQGRAATAERLRLIRTEIYGPEGHPQLARRLGLPGSMWLNYKSGVTVPAPVILLFIEITNTDSHWLHCGFGEKYRSPSARLFAEDDGPRSSHGSAD